MVLAPGDRIEIHGHPWEVFPPTDFHTANRVGDRAIIIGGLGYPEDRRPGQTPVYALDLTTYSINGVETSGEAPGWLFEHEAESDSRGVISVRGGKVVAAGEGEQRFRRNVEDYALDVLSGVWRRLTRRDWLQFSIRQEGRGLFVLEQSPAKESLFPGSVEYSVEPCEDWNLIRFVVLGVPVSVAVEVNEIVVIVEGELPDGLSSRIAEEVRPNAEAAIQVRCVLERV